MIQILYTLHEEVNGRGTQVEVILKEENHAILSNIMLLFCHNKSWKATDGVRTVTVQWVLEREVDLREQTLLQHESSAEHSRLISSRKTQEYCQSSWFKVDVRQAANLWWLTGCPQRCTLYSINLHLIQTWESLSSCLDLPLFSRSILKFRFEF